MTTDQLVMLIAGIVIGIDIGLAVHLIGRHLDDRRDQQAIREHLDAVAARTATPTEDGER